MKKTCVGRGREVVRWCSGKVLGSTCPRKNLVE